MLRRLVVAALSAWLAIGSGSAASALSSKLDAALARLSADSYAETSAAIDEIVLSAVPHAAALLEALGDRRLGFDPASKAVYYRDVAGKTYAAATGAPVKEAPAELTIVRLNNRVRSAAQAALGGLELLSNDAGKRRAAALAVLKSRDATALPILEAALGRETDKGIAVILETARAAIVLAAPGIADTDRLSAIDTLRRRGGQQSLTALHGIPADASGTVQAASAKAQAAIEQNLAIWSVAQNLWYGLSLSSVLLLAAIGLAITFGVMGVINMAHGEMVMLGAYTTFVVQEIIRTSAPWLFGWSLAIAIPAAFLVAGAVGVAIERGVIRFLYGRPLETLLATWGVSLVLQQSVRTIFGPTNREVGTPAFMTGAFELGGLTITLNRLFIIFFAAAIFAALLLALKHTRLGLHMRAVTQNRRMAGSMGIRTGRVDALTFGLGSAIAGLAGVALSQIDNVSPNLGQSYIIDSFLVVVFGGVGNLWGTLVGALTLGLANKLLEPWAGAVLGKIILLVVIIMFIQKRPRGLFALKGRAVEA
jgi:urea transport system permease protein